jgi:hypothetical protein
MTTAFVTRIAARAETNPAVQDAIDDLVVGEYIEQVYLLGTEGVSAQLDFLSMTMSDAEILEALNLTL